MWLTCLLSLLTAAQPDAGLRPLTRTHEVKWLPTAPNQPVRARLDVETFRVADESGTHAFEMLSVSLADGGTTPGLDRVNEAIHKAYKDSSNEPIPSTASLQDGTAPLYAALATQYATGEHGLLGIATTVPFFTGPFIQVHTCFDNFQAYQMTYCEDLLLRVDTGLPWTWLDGVAAAKQPAFLKACTRVLAPASKAARAKYVKDIPEKDLEPNILNSNFPVQCTPRLFNEAMLQPNGDLQVVVSHGWHADQNIAWDLTLPAALLAKWADPKGPLGGVRPKH